MTTSCDGRVTLTADALLQTKRDNVKRVRKVHFYIRPRQYLFWMEKDRTSHRPRARFCDPPRDGPADLLAVV